VRRIIFLISASIFITLSLQKAHSQKNILDKKISVQIENETIEDALKIINELNGFYFAYKGDILPSENRISVIADEKTLKDVLNQILFETEIKFIVVGKQIVLLEKEKPKIPHLISGFVHDKTTNEPIPFAHVSIAETSSGTITNTKGEFVFKLPQDILDADLSISFVGYKTFIIPVNEIDSSELFVYLEPYTTYLEAIEVNPTDSMALCKVLMPEISENYDGECKNGLAHGYGIAAGQDTYKGDFKRGLPHGQGTYFWSSGFIYKGQWINGYMQGYGEFSIPYKDEKSVVGGYWGKNKYLGIEPRPYKIVKSTNIKSVNFFKLDEIGDMIELNFVQLGKEDVNILSLHLDGSSGTHEVTLPSPSTFINVEFPFTGRITYTTIKVATTLGDVSQGGRRIFCELEFEIYQEGIWRVSINN